MSTKSPRQTLGYPRMEEMPRHKPLHPLRSLLGHLLARDRKGDPRGAIRGTSPLHTREHHVPVSYLPEAPLTDLAWPSPCPSATSGHRTPALWLPFPQQQTLLPFGPVTYSPSRLPRVLLGPLPSQGLILVSGPTRTESRPVLLGRLCLFPPQSCWELSGTLRVR